MSANTKNTNLANGKRMFDLHLNIGHQTEGPLIHFAPGPLNPLYGPAL